MVNVVRPEDAPIGAPTSRRDAPGDAIEDVVNELTATIDAEISDADIEMLGQKHVVKTAAWNAQELQRQVRHVANINIYDDTTGLVPHLELAVAENVRLIKGLEQGTLDAIKGAVLRGARTGVHQSVIGEQIAQQLGISKRRAALIATDQVGKLNGELNQIRQQRLGIRRYRWSSSQDERVRKRHRKLNGTIQEWSKPPVADERTGERAHPGQPIRCRCQPIPIIDDVLVDAGLMDPKDVDLSGPGRPQPVPPGLPQPPPANVPPPKRKAKAGSTTSDAGLLRAEMSAAQPPKPPRAAATAASSPIAPGSLPRVPPANVPPTGGGGGPGGPGGGGGGGRPPGPPSEPERQRLVGELRAGMGALPAKGGHAPKIRGATQELLGHYGLAVRPDQPRRVRVEVLALSGGLAGALYPDGVMRLDPVIVRRIKAALTRLKRGAAVTDEQADALATLLHEELHGVGPWIPDDAYFDAGALVEEVTTETLARGTTRDFLGKVGAGRVHQAHPLALPRQPLDRPYDDAISDVLSEIRSITGVDEARSHKLLHNAALMFKQSSGELATPEEVAERFAQSVPGLSATERARFEARIIQLGVDKPVDDVR